MNMNKNQNNQERTPPTGPAPTDPPRKAVLAFRKRMELSGQLVQAAYEGLAKEKRAPDKAWRAASLGVISGVFEVLFGMTAAIDADDLTKLSKVVVEQRQALIAADEGRPPVAKRSGSGGGRKRPQLPEQFGEVVQQIYGTTLAEDVALAPGGAVQTEGQE